jgi:hypothetical protein
VYDYEAYCQAGREKAPECLKYWCDQRANSATAECDAYTDWCGDGDNADLPQCTPPCEALEDPDSDSRCTEPDDGSDDNRRRRRRMMQRRRRLMTAAAAAAAGSTGQPQRRRLLLKR